MNNTTRSDDGQAFYYYTMKCETCGGKEPGRTQKKEVAEKWNGATTKCEACVVRDAGY